VRYQIIIAASSSAATPKSTISVSTFDSGMIRRGK